MRWLLGILLTAAIGALVTSYVNAHFGREADRAKELKGLNEEFSDKLGKRIAAGLRLARILGRSEDREEIRASKPLYDSALDAWSIRRSAYLVAAQRSMPNEHGRDFEHLFERRLVSCMLKPMDAFLTELHRCRMAGATSALKHCQKQIDAKVRVTAGHGCVNTELTMHAMHKKADACARSLGRYWGASNPEPSEEGGMAGLIEGVTGNWGGRADRNRALEQARIDAIETCTFGDIDPSYVAAVQQGVVPPPEPVVLPNDDTHEPGTEDEGTPVDDVPPGEREAAQTSISVHD
jgi:hypothetical protein